MLTQQQWIYIILNLIGLRSGDSPTDINSAASYAMDNGVKMTSGIPSIPSNWLELLKETIKTIKAFPNALNRYLLIVGNSTGQSNEYSNCFPKCSTKPSKVIASTQLNKTEEELVAWVLDNIPTS